MVARLRKRKTGRLLSRDEAVLLVEEWEHYGRNLAFKAWQRGGAVGSLDELRMAAREALWEAALRFEPERGLSFGTYVTFWVRRNIQDLIRAASGAKKSQAQSPQYRGMVTLSLDADYAGNGSCLAPTIPAREEAEEAPDFPADFWERVNKWLDPRSQEVIRLRFREGLTLQECGERIGITRERIRQLEARALRKIGDRVDFGDLVEEL